MIVMEYRKDTRGMGVFLKGPDMRRVCTLAAASRLTKARALVGHISGDTAASGRLTHGWGGRTDDRVRVTISFGFAAVQQQFGNRRTRASRFLTRALEG